MFSSIKAQTNKKGHGSSVWYLRDTVNLFLYVFVTPTALPKRHHHLFLEEIHLGSLSMSQVVTIQPLLVAGGASGHPVAYPCEPQTIRVA